MPSLPTSQRSELEVCHLAQEKATLEVQLEEVTQLLRSEREAAHRREQELLEKMAEANSQIADLTSTNTGTCLFHSVIFAAVFVSPTVVDHFVPSPPYSSPPPSLPLLYTHTRTVLDSEVVDLRVCLQSADKELEELRMERKAEGRVHESRLMEHMQRVGTQHCTSVHRTPLHVRVGPGNKATGNMSMRLHIRACLLTDWRTGATSLL